MAQLEDLAVLGQPQLPGGGNAAEGSHPHELAGKAELPTLVWTGGRLDAPQSQSLTLSRQHSTPILITSEGSISLQPVSLGLGERAVSEADIQDLVHRHASSLPISEIDPMFAGAVAVCRELNTPAGAIDNVLVTPSGLPVLVECKLWRNPQGRREVVGQILDYAKELSRWSSADFEREVNRNLKREGGALLEIVRTVDPSVDEVQFSDALTVNLRRGRFLLLILGDGIREGVETITEYLQAHAGLHFSLGLVEFPLFRMPDGNWLAAPRVLARTHVVTRHVIAVPDGHMVEQSVPDPPRADEGDPERRAAGAAQQALWKEFLDGLKLDDPEQPVPNPPRIGYVGFSMPAPQGSSWLTVYRDRQAGEVGVFLSAHRNTAGDYALHAIGEDFENVRHELGGTVRLEQDQYGRPRVIDRKYVGSYDDPGVKEVAFRWLGERVNSFVNVMRPRVRSSVADYERREVQPF